MIILEDYPVHGNTDEGYLSGHKLNAREAFKQCPGCLIGEGLVSNVTNFNIANLYRVRLQLEKVEGSVKLRIFEGDIVKDDTLSNILKVGVFDDCGDN